MTLSPTSRPRAITACLLSRHDNFTSCGSTAGPVCTNTTCWPLRNTMALLGTTRPPPRWRSSLALASISAFSRRSGLAISPRTLMVRVAGSMASAWATTLPVNFSLLRDGTIKSSWRPVFWAAEVRLTGIDLHPQVVGSETTNSAGTPTPDWSGAAPVPVEVAFNHDAVDASGDRELLVDAGPPP